MVAEMSAVTHGQADGDSVKRKALVSRRLLAAHTEFFAKGAEDPGSPGSTGEGADAELAELAKVLAPGAREALPALLDTLGSTELVATESGESRYAAWCCLLEKWGVLHVFAAAHLLGATELLNAGRCWVAEKEGRLETAISNLDVHEDAGSLRMALDFGLDQKCGKMSLIHAAAAADVAGAVKVLLEKRGDVLLDPETLVDLRDGCGQSPLHVCAIKDSAEAASVLIQASANLEILCALEDDEAACDEAVEGEPGASVKPLRKWTPLHLAASNDSAGVAELLLSARANVAACVSGVAGTHTPLHEAAEANAPRVARVLAVAAAAAAVDLDKVLLAGTGEEAAAGPLGQLLGLEGTESQPNEEDPDAVRWARFLDPLNAKCGHNGSTPLHKAAENDAGDVVTTLLNAKADPMESDDQGDTPLHCAMLFGSPCALNALLVKGVPMMAENLHGELALHHAAEFGLGEDVWPAELGDAPAKRHFARSDRARELLLSALKEHGHLPVALDYKAKRSGGATPLHAVARHDHSGALHALRLLVEAGASLESLDNDNCTPLAIAIRYHGSNGRMATALRAMGAVECTNDKKEFSGSSVQVLSGRGATMADGGVCEDPLAVALGGCVRPLLPLAHVTQGCKEELGVKEECKEEFDVKMELGGKEECKDEDDALKTETAEEEQGLAAMGLE